MDLNKLLEEGLQTYDISIDKEQLNQFAIYKDTLLEYNKVMNLTAIEEEQEIYTKHFLDSASLLLTQKIPAGASVIDVGTGAGFPSVPLKILRPDLELTLLDSLRKRVDFLKELGERLHLDKVQYVHARAEDGGSDPKYRQQFDLAVSRAVAALPVLLEYCIPFVKVGGYFLCQKGPSAQEEVEAARKALGTLGCEVTEVISAEVPFTSLSHKIIVIKKLKPTPKAYPRKAGKPAKEPL